MTKPDPATPAPESAVPPYPGMWIVRADKGYRVSKHRWCVVYRRCPGPSMARGRRSRRRKNL